MDRDSRSWSDSDLRSTISRNMRSRTEPNIKGPVSIPISFGFNFNPDTETKTNQNTKKKKKHIALKSYLI